MCYESVTYMNIFMQTFLILFHVGFIERISTYLTMDLVSKATALDEKRLL